MLDHFQKKFAIEWSILLVVTSKPPPLGKNELTNSGSSLDVFVGSEVQIHTSPIKFVWPIPPGSVTMDEL